MFEIGTATSYLDLLDKLNTFLTAKGSAFGLSYVGTGNGTFTNYRGGASSVAETFEITATSATQFSVVGSVSGNIGTATVGTQFTHAKLELLLTAGGTAFVAGDKFTISTAPKWTAMLAPTVATSTRWRVNVTARDGTANLRIARVEMALTRGGADQVAGSGGTASASSANGSNVAANAADTDNATLWESTGTSGWWEYQFTATKAIKQVAITFPTSGAAGGGPMDFTVEYWNGSAWVIVASFRGDSSWGLTERRVFPLSPYIWKAPGNDGTSEIYVGVHPFENAGVGWYNWRLNGFTSFDAGVSWFSQPGAISAVDPYGPVLPLSNGSIGYWFVANGRRVIIAAKAGTVYGAAYLGLIHPYASPGQWPYPLFVGGALWFEDEPASTSANWLVGTAHSKHTCFPMSFIPNLTGGWQKERSSGRLRKADGEWFGFSGHSDFYTPHEEFPGSTWPYAAIAASISPRS